jgi:N-acetylneuraminate synthase/N,N'-diacetyllegionaminate synthase
MRRIEIRGKMLGDGEPCFVIAEAGVNHNGSLDAAKKLIDIAKWAGADAVKFQAFSADDLVTKDAEKAEYQKAACGPQSQYDMIKGLELGEDEFRELARYSKERELIFLSTPFSARSADILEDIGVPAYKIASGDLTNIPLLKHIARKAKPLIISTGMSVLEEVEYALEAVREEGSKDIALLHCITSYPARLGEANLRAINTLRKEFGLPTGFSDHTLGIIAPIAAVAMGACILEKHFTLDKSLPGPDHKASMEPSGLKEMVDALRDVEKAMGTGEKVPSLEEEKIKKVARRSIVAGINIPKGAAISEEMLTLKRPGMGLSSINIPEIVGRRTKRSISRDELIGWEMLE